MEQSLFTLFRSDGGHHGYQHQGERFADACIDEWDRFGGGSIRVWEDIAQGVKSQLIVLEGNMIAVRYRDEILRPVAVPLGQQRQLILHQDNARPHVARVCWDFLVNNNIISLDWPPHSPDFVPQRAFVGQSGQKGKTPPPPPPNHPPTIKKCFGG